MDKIHEIAGDGALMPRFDDGMVNIAELIRVVVESLVNEIMDVQAEDACVDGSQCNGYRERARHQRRDTTSIFDLIGFGTCVHNKPNRIGDHAG